MATYRKSSSSSEERVPSVPTRKNKRSGMNTGSTDPGSTRLATGTGSGRQKRHRGTDLVHHSLEHNLCPSCNGEPGSGGKHSLEGQDKEWLRSWVREERLKKLGVNSDIFLESMNICPPCRLKACHNVIE